MLNKIEAIIVLIMLVFFAHVSKLAIWDNYYVRKTGTIKVAVIDTGFDFDHPRDVKVCKDGHFDLSSFALDKDGTPVYLGDKPKDFHGHGTHVAGLIAKYAGDSDYCLIFLKYYKEENKNIVNLFNTISAFEQAKRLKVDIINYSGGGPEAEKNERKIVESLLDDGVKIVAAAGNENENLEFKDTKYYPACYDDRIVVVGALNKKGERLKSSNYGAPVDYWEIGEEIDSYLLGGRNGVMSGTSQATAIHTGKLIKELDSARRQ